MQFGRHLQHEPQDDPRVAYSFRLACRWWAATVAPEVVTFLAEHERRPREGEAGPLEPMGLCMQRWLPKLPPYS